MLDRETILSRKTLKMETVDVPEWGGQVLVRELTAAERCLYEAALSDAVNGEQPSPNEKVKRYEVMRARMVVMATVNEEGKRIFKDTDVTEVNQLSGAAIDRIATVIMRLSGYSAEEQEKIKKNSTDSADSASALH